jgi:UDP-glucuronate decarboxylase
MSAQNIVITGSDGTVGPHLAAYLQLQNSKNIITRCDRIKKKESDYVMVDINYYETLSNVFHEDVDIVYHLAGEVSRESGDELPNKTIESNLIGLNNVIQYCLEYNIKLVFTSTSEVYGEHLSCGVPVKENLFSQSANFSKNIYGLTNFMGEQLIEYYCRMYNLEAKIVRLFMSYGPGCYPGPYMGAISRFIDWAKKGEPIQVHKGGIRSHCYVKDIARGIAVVGNSCFDDPALERYNIGSNEEWSMEEVAYKIIELMDSSSEVVFIDPHSSISLIKRACFDKIKDKLGWEPIMPFIDGLKETIKWQLQNT